MSSTGQPSSTNKDALESNDATLISGDSLIAEVAGFSRLGPGKSVGRYIVLTRLAVGVGGVVYAAYDPKLDCKVAIKLLRPRIDGRHDARRTQELLREVQRFAAISHPNVITVHEVGLVHDVVYVAMEHVDGRTLRQWLDAGPHPWELAVEVMRKLGAGLAAVHRAELVHGDFEPGDVLIDAELEPRLADFGLGRRAGDEDPVREARTSRRLKDTISSDSSPTSLTLGPAIYRSPERHTGEPFDARADQFSFCVALYEALYGERPFTGRSLEAMYLAVAEGRVREPSRRAKVPPSLRQVVIRGLARDPAQRWPSMDALLAALAVDPATRRRRLTAGSAAALAVAASVVAILHGTPADSAAPTAAPATEQPELDEPRAAQLTRVRALVEALDRALAAGDLQRAVELTDELERVLADPP